MLYYIYNILHNILYGIYSCASDTFKNCVMEVLFSNKSITFFLAIIWGNIHNDVREMLTYMRKDEEKTQRLKKRFLIKNSLIFLIGSFLLIFIMPFVILFFKNEFGINILFLLSN